MLQQVKALQLSLPLAFPVVLVVGLAARTPGDEDVLDAGVLSLALYHWVLHVPSLAFDLTLGRRLALSLGLSCEATGEAVAASAGPS